MKISIGQSKLVACLLINQWERGNIFFLDSAMFFLGGDAIQVVSGVCESFIEAVKRARASILPFPSHRTPTHTTHLHAPKLVFHFNDPVLLSPLDRPGTPSPLPDPFPPPSGPPLRACTQPAGSDPEERPLHPRPPRHGFRALQLQPHQGDPPVATLSTNQIFFDILKY